MRTVLVTGGAGFFGGILVRRLLEDGFRCVSVDVEPDPQQHENLTSITCDIRDQAALDAVFEEYRFDGVFHAAAVLGHAVENEAHLWECNVGGTEVVADCVAKHGIGKVVYVSTNCLWAEPLGYPIREDEPIRPKEAYGKSKAEAERILLARTEFQTVAIRTPTIIDAGRLGLLAILFEFIDDGLKVWVVGDGENRYQFVFGPDLADACVRGLDHEGSGIFNVGSSDVPTLREAYQAVIDQAGTGARVARLPKQLTIAAMKLAHKLGISPLGPYHYGMIAEDFQFDTSRAKQQLGWSPTLTNEQMLTRAYLYYQEQRKEIEGRENVSAHRQAADMGVIRLLKWVS